MTTEKEQLCLYIAKQSPTGKPSFYTSREGGDWRSWPKDHPFDYEWLSLRRRHPLNVVSMGLAVHSISFGHPLAGYDKILHWDCVNGFGHIVPKPHY